MLLYDLDGFKQVHDRFGHQEGNRILKLVAAGLHDSCRETDYVARMGGDEFVLVLPSPSLKNVAGKMNVLDHGAGCGHRALRRAAAQHQYRYGLVPEHGRDAESLLAEADRRMYLAKQARRISFSAPRALAPHL